MSKAVLSGPMSSLAGEGVSNAASRPRPILGMNLLLPEIDIPARGGTVVPEQRLETLRPGKRAGCYIPIPNSIIRSPGNNRKMFRALKRAAFRNFIMSFMFLPGVSGT